MTVDSREGHYVQSLERGLAVVRAFDAGHAELTLSEVARRTGLTRAAARRFLLTLVDLGYVRSDGRVFALTPRVLDLGYAYLSSLSLPDVAEPHLERLVAEVHESSSLSVLDGEDIVYVARVPTTRIMTVSINVGTRFPAHATSMGRVLLAGLHHSDLDRFLPTARLDRLTDKTLTSSDALRDELDRVRQDGYSVVDQELEPGLRSIAIPIRGTSRYPLAAMNVSAHASRTSLKHLRTVILPAMLATRRSIEADLPGRRRVLASEHRSGATERCGVWSEERGERRAEPDLSLDRRPTLTLLSSD
jgi:IclR family transcriptional regulator, pca regulon regulatory protein